MPKALSVEAREAIKMRLLEGKRNNTDIADEVGVSIQTVKNYSANLASFGDILPPKISRIGRPPILTQAMVDVRC
jgi:transposase